MSYTNVSSDKLPFSVRYIADLLTYRHLAYNLVGGDLRSRFRRSYLGILWAVIQPLSFSLVIGFVWGSLFKYESIWEFALFIFSGMVVWEYFLNTVSGSQDSLISSEGYLRQTRIPFLIFQMRQPLAGMVVLLAGCVGLVGYMLVMDFFPAPGWHLLLVPLFFPVLLLFSIPLAVIMSILGTRYRDLKHITLIATQALFFVSPVMLGREVLERPELEFMQYANPVVPLLDLFRAPLLYGDVWRLESLGTLSSWIVGLWLVAIVVSVKVGRKIIFSL
jgi:lipopolysaccharide transport system permease protein